MRARFQRGLAFLENLSPKTLGLIAILPAGLVAAPVLLLLQRYLKRRRKQADAAGLLNK